MDGNQNQRRRGNRPWLNDSKPSAIIATMANDAANVQRLCESIFSPGMRNRDTRPGMSSTQAKERKMRISQKALTERCRRLHQASGAISNVASKPAYAAAELSS